MADENAVIELLGKISREVGETRSKVDSLVGVVGAHDDRLLRVEHREQEPWTQIISAVVAVALMVGGGSLAFMSATVSPLESRMVRAEEDAAEDVAWVRDDLAKWEERLFHHHVEVAAVNSAQDERIKQAEWLGTEGLARAVAHNTADSDKQLEAFDRLISTRIQEARSEINLNRSRIDGLREAELHSAQADKDQLERDALGEIRRAVATLETRLTKALANGALK